MSSKRPDVQAALASATLVELLKDRETLATLQATLQEIIDRRETKDTAMTAGAPGGKSALLAVGARSLMAGRVVNTSARTDYHSKNLPVWQALVQRIVETIAEIDSLKAKVEAPKPEDFKQDSAAIQIARLCGTANSICEEASGIIANVADRYARLQARDQAAKLAPTPEEPPSPKDDRSRPRPGSGG